MRKLLIASASAVVLFSAAGAAQAEGAVGHVGANYARTDLDAGGVDADQDVFQAEGSVAFDTGSLGVASTARSPTVRTSTPCGPARRT
jgi:opacity protein-like surface antigen